MGTGGQNAVIVDAFASGSGIIELWRVGCCIEMKNQGKRNMERDLRSGIAMRREISNNYDSKCLKDRI